MTEAEKVANWMEKSGYTQTDMARMLQFTPSGISQMLSSRGLSYKFRYRFLLRFGLVAALRLFDREFDYDNESPASD